MLQEINKQFPFPPLFTQIKISKITFPQVHFRVTRVYYGKVQMLNMNETQIAAITAVIQTFTRK
jgi:hypothetical protein